MASDGKIKVVAELDVSKYQAQLKKMQAETKGTANNLQSSISKSLNQATLGLGPKLSKGIKSVLSEIDTDVQNRTNAVLQRAKNNIIKAAQSAGNGLKSVASTAGNATKNALSGAYSAVQTVLQNLANNSNFTITGIIKSVVRTVASGVRQIISIVASIPGAVLNAIKSIPSLIMRGITSIISGVVSLGKTMASTAQAAGRAIMSAIKAIPGLLRSVSSGILNFIKSIPSGIMSVASAINQLPRTIASGMSSVLDGIKSGISSLPSTLGGAFNALKSGVSGVVDKMRDVGSVGVSAGKQALEAFKGLASTCGSLVASLVQVAAKITAVGAAAAAAGLAKVFKGATEEMGEFQQQIGGTDKLFGDASRKVQANAANAFRTAGMSANDYMKEVTLYSGALIRGLGDDTNKAADYADKAIKQMSDNVNTFGTSTASVQYAYRGFARKQYTMLDNLRLGYDGTRKEMARLVNDSGVMGENFKATAKNIDEVSFDKIIDAIGVVQDRLKVTGTTAQEAEHTLQGSQRAMAASWKNWLTALGDQGKEGALNIDVYTKRLVSSVSTYLQNLGPIVKGVAMGLQNSLPDLAKAIQDALPTIISAVTNVLNLLVSMVGVLLPYVIQIVQSLINALVAQLPMILPTLIDAIIAVVI